MFSTILTSVSLGLLSATSPCILPLYPGFLAYLSGAQEATGNRRGRYFLGFFVLAPQSQVERGVFEEQLEPESIWQKVEKRVREYEGDRDKWFAEYFAPTFEAIKPKIAAVPWEELIATIRKHDTRDADSIQDFYDKCEEFNR